MKETRSNHKKIIREIDNSQLSDDLAWIKMMLETPEDPVDNIEFRSIMEDAEKNIFKKYYIEETSENGRHCYCKCHKQGCNFDFTFNLKSRKFLVHGASHYKDNSSEIFPKGVRTTRKFQKEKLLNTGFTIGSKRNDDLKRLESFGLSIDHYYQINRERKKKSIIDYLEK